MGDTLDGYGGADIATARIRHGWNKFREMIPFLISSAPVQVYVCQLCQKQHDL